MRILLVEDDESIVDLVTTVLGRKNYIIDTAADGEAGWELVEAFPYDLVLLDIVLPKLDGISLCRRLREHKKQALVMLLTAQDAMSDKLIGLQAGADDYLVKPFHVQELDARIHALLRRGNPITETVLRCGDLRLDPTACEITYADHLLRFSRKEYLLLELFLRQQQRVFSRSAIVDQIWSFNEDPPNEDTVKSHIKSIRRKLDAVGASNLIETLYGQGYRINPAYLAAVRLAQAAEIAPDAAPDATSNLEQQTADLKLSMMTIWQRTKSLHLERVTLLEQAIELLKTAKLTPALRQTAVQTAHKLVGSLGTFGFESGSKTAQQLEIAFQQQAIDSAIQPNIVQLNQWVQSLRQLLQSSAHLPPDPAESARPQLQPESLLLLAQDQTWLEATAAQIAASAPNLQLIQATTAAAAMTLCQQLRPQVALIDFADLKQDGQAQELLELLKAPPLVPILFLSEQSTTQARIEAVQAGGSLFLPKPVLPAQLQAALTRLNSTPKAFKILIIQDDPLIAKNLETDLDPSIQLTRLSDPAQLWDLLDSTRVDLLIVDMDMDTPKTGGIQLCQTLRADLKWDWLPVIFLTAQANLQTDLQTERRIFAAGADDLIFKPVQPIELSTRILNRLRRSASARRQL